MTELVDLLTSDVATAMANVAVIAAAVVWLAVRSGRMRL
jgi:hypothetical protein